VDTQEGEFVLADHERFLARNADSIVAFRATQTRAFEEEKDRWRASGEFDVRPEPPAPVAAEPTVVPDGALAVTAPFGATVTQVSSGAGDVVADGTKVLALEAMKMETSVAAPAAGEVVGVYVVPGQAVAPGQVLFAVRADEGATA
jgi:urea carboxylase